MQSRPLFAVLLVAASLAMLNPAQAQGSGGDPPFVPASETRADLMALYQATGGDKWHNNAGWGSETDHCTWFGVTCLEHDHVDYMNYTKYTQMYP